MIIKSSINSKKVSWLGAGMTLVVLTFATSTVSAKSLNESSGIPTSKVTRSVADNVVVTPGASAAPAQPPAQTVVVPQASAPAAAPAAAVVQEPNTRHKEVNAEVTSPHNYMTTIAVSALMGALTGGLVGGAIYYLGDRQNGINIAYWAAGGVLLGTGVGIAQVMVQESRMSNATASRFPSDPAPTYRLSLLRLNF